MSGRGAAALNHALALLHRQLLRGARVLPEVAVALLDDAELARTSTVEHYDATTAYTTPANQDLGLYPYENRALEQFFPAGAGATLLVPGAGAGREASALRRKGYAVDAFDASPALVNAGRARFGDDAVELRELGDWASEIEKSPAPPRYDGIFAGWGLWTHIVRRDARLAALRAFRRACPEGPLLLSFWRREKVFDLEEDGIEPIPDTKLRHMLGLIRTRVLGREPLEPGTVWRAGMFVHLVSETELDEEAQIGGYRVAHYERDGSRLPNAVLLPR